MTEEQVAYPCIIMRGGTSRAILFQEKDLPPKGPERDYVLQKVMGQPDKLQIDGIGGGQLATSKIAIIGPPSIPDADIDYTFVQILVDHDGVDYEGNCGNISSAVAPFAIDVGLIKPVAPKTVVRIYNTNTQKVFIAEVPIIKGQVKVKGDYFMAGIPGSGAEIILDFRKTVGAKTGKLLPTGKVSEKISLEGGKSIEVSICDAANPGVFAKAEDLGLRGTELPHEIDSNTIILNQISEIKSKVAERIGLVDNWHNADSKTLLPFVVVVAHKADYITSDGQRISATDIDLLARLIALNTCHPSYAGTGAICTAACAAISGSIPNRLLRSPLHTMRIGHPKGIMPVKSVTRGSIKNFDFEFTYLGFSRTARKIMEGKIYVPTQE
jgi:2-methylaconitate cis-trans-isomerase PrpF